MARENKKIEGGSGGRRGHSNMTHWDRTETIKAETKRLRRLETLRIKTDSKRHGP